MIRILQLSDLHFGESHFFEQTGNDPNSFSLAQSIEDALNRELGQLEIDFLLLTGDYFSEDHGYDLNFAVRGISNIIEVLNISPKNVICIPGNHDLTWREDYQSRPFNFYDRLVQQLDLHECSSEDFPSLSVFGCEGKLDKPLVFAKLNSCMIESSNMAGIGRIGENQLRKLRNKLQEINPENNEIILIVALHHHLLPISPVELIWDPNHPTGQPIAKSSHTVDAVDILTQLSELGASLIVHGHQHHAAVLNYSNLLVNKDVVLNIVGSGSCGAKQTSGSTLNRQFFLYEITSTNITLKTFKQSFKNESRFDLDRDGEINLLPNYMTPIEKKYCLQEAQMQFGCLPTGEEVNEDYSDLHLLLFSVVDCNESRKILKQKFQNLLSSELWNDLRLTYFNVRGMYDLYGQWDLIVRFRCDLDIDIKRLVKDIQKCLEDEKMMENPRRNSSSVFSRIEHLNILRELTSWSDLDNQPQRISINRRLIYNTQDYDELRCQRVFLYVQLPSSTDDKNDCLKALRDVIVRDRPCTNIIEGIYIADRALVFEIFLTCAQSSYLNRLNRIIGPVLAEFRLQKYTLLCYDYEEEVIDVLQ